VVVNGINKNLVEFFSEPIYLGKREAPEDYVFAVGTWNGEVIATITKQDSLPELADNAFLLPQRFLMSAYRTLRQLTTEEIDRLSAPA
jgi:hypothetical protein